MPLQEQVSSEYWPILDFFSCPELSHREVKYSRTSLAHLSIVTIYRGHRENFE
jgi:hypothetical protein